MDLSALEQHAMALKQAGRLDEAAAAYAQLARAAPKSHGYLYNLGNCHMAAGQPEAAVEAYRRALRLAPRFAPAHNNLGLAQIGLKRFALAAAALERAVALDPGNLASRHMAGHALLQDGRAAEALPYLEEAARQAPGNAVILTDYADALRRCGRLLDAAAPARAAAALAPARIEVWNNLANAERDRRDYAAAAAASRRALAIDPGNAEAHCNLALTLLAAGDLAQAWPHWEYRWAAFAGGVPPFPEPPWRGAALPAGRLLLYGEQGFGDAIQFSRYVPMAAARAEVALLVRRPLLRLMRTLAPGLSVHAEGDAVPDYAAQAPLMSLPLAFGTQSGAIPAEVPYLRADAGAVASWRARLAALPGRRVGLAWAGSRDFPHDAARSIPPQALAPLARVPGVSWVSLQKDAAARPDLAMSDWTAELGDFADTAALVAALDLVISVDTAVLHLAGALGRPAWLMNRFAGDWRWGPQGVTSPWYPTIEVFRQATPGDWPGVAAAIAARLAQDAPP